MQRNGNQEQQAEAIALQGLTYFMSQPKLIESFLHETGFEADVIRTQADSPEVLEAVLTVLLGDEATLLTFAANAGLQPTDVVTAYQTLTETQHGKRPIVST